MGEERAFAPNDGDTLDDLVDLPGGVRRERCGNPSKHQRGSMRELATTILGRIKRARADAHASSEPNTPESSERSRTPGILTEEPPGGKTAQSLFAADRNLPERDFPL